MKKTDKPGKVFIIAEAGVNHNGSVDVARKMIDAAAGAGADAVKFQVFNAESEISRYAPKAEYQKKATDASETQLDMARRLELAEDEFRELFAHCRKRGIIFLATPFDLRSVDFLDELGLDIIKVPSGEITNLPYLRKIGRLNKKIIMSTGMADLKEVGEALDILVKSGTKKENITILHCHTDYPTKMQDVNLRSMLSIQDAFKIDVGYSDHTLGAEAAVAAVALGAKVIEKHFTLDTLMEGPDHKASLDPQELESMIRAIRNVEDAMGDGFKKASAPESAIKAVARKSIVALRNIKKGEAFTEENITTKRPGTGINPMQWDGVIGKKAKRDFCEDELIEL
jgi:N,N'-diacetyllegionaminate synthase